MKHLERTTSGGGGGVAGPMKWALCFSIAFTASATTTSASAFHDSAAMSCRAARTDSGQSRKEEAEHSDGVSEVRRLSGLTWDQVATLFGVSRRAAHHWASGKPMTAENELHLLRVLGSLRALHVGSARPNRQMLLAPVEPGGASIFDLLRERKYDLVAQLVGQPQHGPAVRSQLVVPEDRLPLKPEQLISTAAESFNVPTGPRKRAKAVRVKRA